MSWRDVARPIIAKVLKEHAGADPKTIKAALRAAYPFGERAYHPYKIWCDEVRVQVDGKAYRARKATVRRAEADAKVEQLGLFGATERERAQ